MFPVTHTCFFLCLNPSMVVFLDFYYQCTSRDSCCSVKHITTNRALTLSSPQPHAPAHRHYTAAVPVHKPARMSLNRYAYVEPDFSGGIAVTRL